jgi:hypothetical protein
MVVLLMVKGKCSWLRAKSGKLSGHLPPSCLQKKKNGDIPDAGTRI